MFIVMKPASRLKTAHALLAIGMLAILNSNAAAMRCGTELVDEGDTQLEVALKCGEPTFVEQNRWHYNLGPHKFIKILHFQDGQLHWIEEGQYGSSDTLPSAAVVID